MLIIDRMNKEPQFEVRTGQYSPGYGFQAVKVHPWHRYKDTDFEDSKVFLSVGHYKANGEENYIEGEGEPVWNILVDREEFVEGLLRVFPELARSEEMS